VDLTSNGAVMQWFGKALGGLIGLVAAGPVGSVLGFILGHQLDESDGRAFRGERKQSLQQISQLFFEVAFEVMGQIAKVDGRVSEDEVRVARNIMHGMQLAPDQVREAIDRFTQGKSTTYPLADRLAKLERQIGDRAELSRAFVQLQLQSAIGAGPIGPEKRQLLWRVASALGLSRADLAQIESLVRAHQRRGQQRTESEAIAEAYRVLGVGAAASDDDIKKAYRRLMNQHHPDKLVARGLPASMVGVAEQKTLEVRAAYEKLKARRGFK
jgi:DnaJ like chaperone protein